jgi:hypothetical protein
MKEFLGRLPFTLIGSIGLISLVSNFLTLGEDLGLLVEAWQQTTRPVWEQTLGYFVDLPNVLKDYFTGGVIFAGMLFRSGIFAEALGETWTKSSLSGKLFIAFFTVMLSTFIWPLWAMLFAKATYEIRRDNGSIADLKLAWERERALADTDQLRQLIDESWQARVDKVNQGYLLWESLVYAIILIAVSYVTFVV